MRIIELSRAERDVVMNYFFLNHYINNNLEKSCIDYFNIISIHSRSFATINEPRKKKLRI